jgi:hypothetical protein
MPLSEEQTQHFVGWLQSRAPSAYQCPSCFGKTFAKPEFGVMPVAGVVAGAAAKPAITAIVLACMGCGLLRFYSPYIVGIDVPGLLPSPPEAPEGR